MTAPLKTVKPARSHYDTPKEGVQGLVKAWKEGGAWLWAIDLPDWAADDMNRDADETEIILISMPELEPGRVRHVVPGKADGWKRILLEQSPTPLEKRVLKAFCEAEEIVQEGIDQAELYDKAFRELNACFTVRDFEEQVLRWSAQNVAFSPETLDKIRAAVAQDEARQGLYFFNFGGSYIANLRGLYRGNGAWILELRQGALSKNDTIARLYANDETLEATCWALYVQHVLARSPLGPCCEYGTFNAIKQVQADEH